MLKKKTADDEASAVQKSSVMAYSERRKFTMSCCWLADNRLKLLMAVLASDPEEAWS